MRVLHVVNDFLPFTRAGTEHYLAELMDALSAQGIVSSVLHLTPLELRADGYEIFEGKYEPHPSFMFGIPEGDRRLLENVRAAGIVRRWLEYAPYDLVHVHSLIGFSASLLDGIPPHIPVVMTFHDFWLLCANAILIDSQGAVCSGPESEEKCAACLLRGPEREFEDIESGVQYIRRRNQAHRRAMARLDLAVCPSHFSRRTYKTFGFDSPHLQRFPLGMQPVPAAFPTSNPSPPSPVRLAYLGGICWFKGLDLVVNAFRAVRPENARLDIHGVVSSTEYFDGIMELIRDEENISYHGPYAKEDLPGILSRADAVVLPSRMETYSFVAREALSAGVPVIASDSGALPEVVRDGKNGLLFRSGDAVDLARTLQRLLADPTVLDALRTGIGPVTTMERDARNLTRYYRRLVEGRRMEGS